MAYDLLLQGAFSGGGSSARNVTRRMIFLEGALSAWMGKMFLRDLKDEFVMVSGFFGPPGAAEKALGDPHVRRMDFFRGGPL